MNYEEKYKQALERAKYLKENTDSVGALDISANFEYIFPELRKSKDERIRKGLVKGLSAMRDIHHHQTFSDDAINIDDAIAWLEKQGEQGIIDLKEYAKGILKGAAIHLMIWIDENLADGKMCLSNMECEDLADAMVNAKWDKIYNYIKKKVEKQGAQPSWSEEDEKCFIELDTIIYQNSSLEDYNRLYHWLKSLKPNHWKPSDEQMEALKKRTHGLHASSETRKALESLINDLEKLRLC